MANVLNRTTKEYRRSVNTPAFPTADWVINPSGADSLVASGVPFRNWFINPDDSVREMTEPEKDSSNITFEKTNCINKLRSSFVVYMDGKYDVSSQVTINALWNEGNGNSMNNRRNAIQTVMAWFSSVLQEFYNRKNAVLAATTVAAVLAVSHDFSSFDATFPGTSVEDIFNIKN